MRDSRTPTGFRYGCKCCFLLKQAKRRSGTRERDREYSRSYESQEHVKARRRKYTEDNRDIYREACRKWREGNPGKQQESTRKYLKANPHKKRQFDRTYRARKLGAEHEPYTADDILSMWHQQDGRCYYCDTPVFGTYHLDHKQPLSRGGADRLENLCVACPFCNNSKKDKTEQEFTDYRKEN